jgi:hypothetical protein
MTQKLLDEEWLNKELNYWKKRFEFYPQIDLKALATITILEKIKEQLESPKEEISKAFIAGTNSGAYHERLINDGESFSLEEEDEWDNNHGLNKYLKEKNLND